MTYDDMFDHEIPDGDEPESVFDAEDEMEARALAQLDDEMWEPDDYEIARSYDKYVHEHIWRE